MTLRVWQHACLNDKLEMPVDFKYTLDSQWGTMVGAGDFMAKETDAAPALTGLMI